MPDSLREEISTAFTASQEGDGAVADAGAGSPPPPAAEADAVADPAAPIVAEAPEVGTPGEKHPSNDGRVRDAAGRFTTKPTAAPLAGPDGKTPAALPGDAAKQAADAAAKAQQDANRGALGRAPQSWTPGAREAWAQVPEAARAEIMRREGEVQKAFQQMSGARNFTEQMTAVVNPHLSMIQSTGANPFEFIGGVLQAASILRGGTSQDKAGFVAHLIKQHGVDIAMLDSVLAGQPVPQAQGGGVDQAAIARLVQQHMAPVQQFMGTFQARQQEHMQRLESEVMSEIDRFAADTKNEFYEDVKGIMADLTEVAARNGRDLPMAEAYKQACLLHPGIEPVMIQRQSQTAANAANERARKAKAASVGIHGAPGGTVGGSVTPKTDSLRDTIAAQFANAAGQ